MRNTQTIRTRATWRRIATAAAVALAATAATLVPAAPANAAAGAPAVPTQDPFYAYGGPLTGIARGTVLRSRTISTGLTIGTQFTARQVLYRTTNELGQPSVTVATILQPTLPNPHPKLVSYQLAYDSLGAQCDPSYTIAGGNPTYILNLAEEKFIGLYLALGDTVVTSDYEGENLDWAAGQEEGYNTLDGIAAAEHALDLPTGTPVGLVGYSGGAIATQWAAELAPRYAPGLRIVGTAIGGVLDDIAHNLAYVNGTPDWSDVTPAGLVSLGRAFGVNITPYLSSYGLELTHQVAHECFTDFYGAYPGLTMQKLLKPPYTSLTAIPQFTKILNTLIMGTDGTPREPMLIANGNSDGTGDGMMIAGDTEALAHGYCQRGVPVQYTQYNGLNHYAAAVPFTANALTFLTAVLDGQHVANGCNTIGTGNSLTPLAAPINPLNLNYRYLGHARIQLSTVDGTLTNLRIQLHQGHKLIATIKLASINTTPRTLRLRGAHKPPRHGRYTITITDGPTTLTTTKITFP